MSSKESPGAMLPGVSPRASNAGA